MDEWGERDRVLAEALIEFEENATCPKCGQLRSKAWDEDTKGSWEHSQVKCYACAGHEEKSKDEGEPGPGVLKFLTLNEDDMRRAKARRDAGPIDLEAI